MSELKRLSGEGKDAKASNIAMLDLLFFPQEGHASRTLLLGEMNRLLRVLNMWQVNISCEEIKNKENAA